VQPSSRPRSTAWQLRRFQFMLQTPASTLVDLDRIAHQMWQAAGAQDLAGLYTSFSANDPKCFDD